MQVATWRQRRALPTSPVAINPQVPRLGPGRASPGSLRGTPVPEGSPFTKNDHAFIALVCPSRLHARRHCFFNRDTSERKDILPSVRSPMRVFVAHARLPPNVSRRTEAPMQFYLDGVYNLFDRPLRTCAKRLAFNCSEAGGYATDW